MQQFRTSLFAMALAAGFAPSLAAIAAEAPTTRPAGEHLNILLITADDMNFDCLGVTGCKIPNITPNIDKLASQGMRFVQAHVTVAVCQPSRSVLMTGRYPYNNGAMGFEPIRTDVPTLQESLRRAGYLNGIFAKVIHLAPQSKFCWDVVVDAPDLGAGRDPKLYYQHSKAFFEKARAEGKPFCLMANSQDPHRPFVGAEGAARRPAKRRKLEVVPESPVLYQPNEVPVPCFLPDLPGIRQELAQYFSSVHRCDETVGQILRALHETGFDDTTLVMFLSDNGMPFPFAKTNCYRTSTRTPWIVRWPGKVKPGVANHEHFISGIDFTPTMLDAAGVPPIAGVDGRSFLPLLKGEDQPDRDRVFTVFHETSGKGIFPMRSVQDARFGYIFNAWSDGKKMFQNESVGTPSYKAMEEAKANPHVAARVKMFRYRVPEELYDYEKDPCALRNLIDDPASKPQLDRLRAQMLKTMQESHDPLLATFQSKTGVK